ncbi:hypothetical protein B0T40_15805 [Chromobacterium haemolyticum]|uniref:phage tail assembly chaperone n=1 Tax=Chromobacterium haemolyticum TaxID=394935 RepID=UPI0009EFD689|nr:phage tail assembly chaperone [Chromobacterium haemolyticum]OQS34306.1 hypothetical protein B0T40_15805 [Chromobacterium haemolyticum]
MTEIVEKTVYAYHPQTGEYAGATTAMRSPLDVDEIYLIPAWAAEAAPPAAGEHQAAVFRADDGSVPRHSLYGGVWQLLPDWRGVALWSKTTAQRVTAQLGDTLDSLSATELEPPAFPIWVGDHWEVDQAAQEEAARLSELTEEERAAQARAERDQRLAATEWLVQRHRDEIDLGCATTLSGVQFAELLTYRQALRDVPVQTGFPKHITWPDAPAF